MADLPNRIRHTGGPLALDFALADRFIVVLAGDVSALSVSNLVEGQVGRLTFKQNPAGGHTVSMGGLTPGTPAPVVSATASSATRLQVRLRGGVTKIWLNEDQIERPEQVALAVEDVIGGADTTRDTLAKVGAEIDALPGPNTGDVARLTAAGGETTLLLPQAVPADKAWTLQVTINGQVLDADVDFTTDGTTTLHLTNPLLSGFKIAARHVHPY